MRAFAIPQAAREGKSAATKLLLAHGASVDAVDAEGWTPLHGAAMSDR